MNVIQLFYLPLHVFSMVVFGGVVFGCLFQISLMMFSQKEALLYRDMAVLIATLLLGIPFSACGLLTGFIMASQLSMMTMSWVIYGLYALCGSVALASMGGGLFFIFMMRSQVRIFGYMAGICYLFSWMLWVFAIVQMIGKGTL